MKKKRSKLKLARALNHASESILADHFDTIEEHVRGKDIAHVRDINEVADGIEASFHKNGLDPIPRKWIIEAIRGYGGMQAHMQALDEKFDIALKNLMERISEYVERPDEATSTSSLAEKRHEVALVTGFLAEWEELKKLFLKLGKGRQASYKHAILRCIEIAEIMRERVEIMQRWVREEADYEREFARLQRLEAAREAQQVKPMEGTKCSRPECHRPARVDDLCKRHAHEAGTLPHGKIGEG